MDVWDGKNVLITGVTGLLGGHLAESLAKRKSRVVAIVRDDIPDCYLKSEGIEKKITVVRGKLEDYFLLERTMNEYEVEVCFHLGAQTIVRTANRSPLSTFHYKFGFASACYALWVGEGRRSLLSPFHFPLSTIRCLRSALDAQA